jgi:hypothetical protein
VIHGNDFRRQWIGSGSPRGDGFPRRLPDLLQNLIVLGKSSGLMFRVDHTAIDFHIEDASASRDQFDVVTAPGFDRIRQTGGFGLIVSLHAVRDRDHWSGSLFLSF